MNQTIVSEDGMLGSFGILVHGGAGQVKPERQALHVAGCRRAAEVGLDVLRAGGSALDAVERAARELEDDVLFNAGTGACLDEDGRVMHDASIMEGRDLRAGGVCSLAGFRNPIAIARAALEDGRHVLYAGEGAARFARTHGFVQVNDAEIVTDAAREALELVRAGKATTGWAGSTIGAVALDASGLVAAATSTGGMVNKRAGRVGDSPLIGSGTYADDGAGAVSTTGHGEGMIRLSIAHSIAELMRQGQTAEQATRSAIERLQTRLGFTGGAIAIDRSGRFGLARSTATMSWAVASENGVYAGI
ncbi:MAG TPA: isoaspartyl peptidase/L-asparaginase [Polyangium sp.]|nr:isoaspartyl peptidase/L-asparaginase [Polyangium sp.]